MNLAIRDSASRFADAAREIGGDVATALAWLEAARGDLGRNRPPVSHAPDAVRVAAARGPRPSELCSAARDLFDAAPRSFAAPSIRFVTRDLAA